MRAGIAGSDIHACLPPYCMHYHGCPYKHMRCDSHNAFSQASWHMGFKVPKKLHPLDGYVLQDYSYFPCIACLAASRRPLQHTSSPPLPLPLSVRLRPRPSENPSQ
eukprot:140269-Chlamydomonas_euryale.AAC.1